MKISGATAGAFASRNRLMITGVLCTMGGTNMGGVIIKAGVVEYSQILHKGEDGSGFKGMFNRCVEILGRVVSVFLPCHVGFWIALAGIGLFVIFRLSRRRSD